MMSVRAVECRAEAEPPPGLLLPFWPSSPPKGELGREPKHLVSREGKHGLSKCEPIQIADSERDLRLICSGCHRSLGANHRYQLQGIHSLRRSSSQHWRFGAAGRVVD